VSDPVSWLVVEHGWTVVGSDGSELGSVDEIVGDTDKDIFNGLSVSPGFLRSPRYVPSERVRAITEGRVELDLDERGFRALDDHGEVPPSARLRPDTTNLS
jgi:sporulation protein YlmC with PRC-barrel domain